LTLSKPFSISTKFEYENNGVIFWITNVYGPNVDDILVFFEELKELKDHIHHSWLIAGDFNSVRSPLECSTLHMSTNENNFNDFIWELSLQEIPLLTENTHGATCKTLPFSVN
jgi:hypothetical protein